MPTPLPKPRRFWRRHTPTTATVRNVTSTAAEFTLALLFVSVAVLAIARYGTIGTTLPPQATATLPLKSAP